MNNESVTVPDAYTLNDNDVAEVLQNMNSNVQVQEVEEETTEETTEEAPMNVEEILQQVQQQADIISAAASSAAPLNVGIIPGQQYTTVAVDTAEGEDNETVTNEVNLDEPEEDFNEEIPENPVEQVVEQPDENIEKIKKILADNNDDEEHSRFKGASWYDIIQQKVIMLAGIGGIGSWTALLLARLNPKAIWLYDDDRVEVANMSGQLFGMDDCRKFKTSAMVDTIKRYTTFNDIFEKSERINSSSEATDIMICGFDNMEARKTYFTLWIKYIRSLPQDKRSNCLFIDGRLSIDTAQVFVMRGDDEYSQEQYYRKYLFSDWNAEATQCSLKQTSFMASFIGSVIANMLVNFCTEDGELPFKTEYNSKFVLLKRED